MRSSVLGLTTAIGCVVGAGGNTSAQRVSVAAVDVWTTHDLLERPRGFSASVSFPLTARWSWSLTVERARGDRTGTGVVCGGFILEPDRCPAERFTQVGRLTLGGVGVEALLVRTSRLGLVARPQLLAGEVRSAERATASENFLDASKAAIGFSAGLELRATPVRRVPLDLIGGATTGRVGPLVHDQSLDAYIPFERWYSVRSLYAGVSLAVRRSRLPFRPARVNRERDAAVEAKHARIRVAHEPSAKEE
jgi:hypothetical protein